MIPNDIYTNIFKFLDFGYIVPYLQTCKNNRDLLIYAKDTIAYKKKYIEERFCPEIIDLIGNINYLIAMPILPWNNRFIGGTYYIDRISRRDLDFSTMIGQDCYNRSYIVFRFMYNTKKKIIVLFQRYKNEKNTWTSAGSEQYIICEPGHFMSCGRLNHKLLKNNIQNLLNNKNVISKYKWMSDDLEYETNLYLV